MVALQTQTAVVGVLFHDLANRSAHPRHQWTPAKLGFFHHRPHDTLRQHPHALAHAHARGVIHRDIKGANVLIAGGNRTVKLADFGLANPIFDTEAPGAKAEQGVAGTPWYMAPEQFAGERQDQGAWTDLYAFGCLAWALPTWVPPCLAAWPLPAD